MMKYWYILFLSVVSVGHSFCQSDSLIHANSLYKGMQYQKAEQVYLKTAKDSTTRIKSLYNLGNTYYQLKKYDEALKKYETCLQESNNHPDINIAHVKHNIGNTLLKQNQYDKAIEAYKSALRLNPNDEETRYNLQYALDQKKKNNNKKKDPKENKQDSPKNDSNKPQPQNDKKKSQEDRTREQMKRILDRLNKKEQKVKKKAEGKKSSGNSNNQTEKDW